MTADHRWLIHITEKRRRVSYDAFLLYEMYSNTLLIGGQRSVVTTTTMLH